MVAKTKLISTLFGSFCMAMLAVMPGLSFAQQIQESDEEAYARNLNQEVFVHLDQPFYSNDDWISFSLFNYRSSDHVPVPGDRYMALSLVNASGVAVVSKTIKVSQGRSSGRFKLPAQTPTGVYMLMVRYPYERVENYLYRAGVMIYNEGFLEDEILSEAGSIQEKNDVEGKFESETGAALLIESDQNSYSRRERVEVELHSSGLLDEMRGHVSVVVRSIDLYDFPSADFKDHLRDTDLPELLADPANRRANRSIAWDVPQTHALLLHRIQRLDQIDQGSTPEAYNPENLRAYPLFSSRGNEYVLNLTGISPGDHQFYFNTFSRESELNGIVTMNYILNDGEVKMGWVGDQTNYQQVIPDYLKSSPPDLPVVKEYLRKKMLRKRFSKAYGYEEAVEKQHEIPFYRPSDWKNVADYEELASLTEFLQELFFGVRVLGKDSKREVRLRYEGGTFKSSPLFIVNGLPSLDAATVLDIELSNVTGAGVLRQETADSRHYLKNEEDLRQFSNFGFNGVIAIELREGAINPLLKPSEYLLTRETYLPPVVPPTKTFDSEEDLNSTKPEFRTVLYWNPDFKIQESSPNTFRFFTSDDVGAFVIEVQGLTEKGEVLLARKVITVK